MELEIRNQEKNIQVVLIEEEKELAMATCYFENTPKVNNKNIGCIGEFVCHFKTTKHIINCCTNERKYMEKI